MASVRNSELIVVGDFNFKDIDWVTYSSTKSLNHPEFKFVENIKDLFLFQHVNEPTRYRENNKPSTLDLIFSSDENLVKMCSTVHLSCL